MQNAINQVNLRIPIPNADERGHTSDDFNGAYDNPYNISEIPVSYTHLTLPTKA